MLSPQTPQDSILALLESIPDLVEFIGDVDYIQGYDDESQTAGTSESAALSQIGRALMVVWTGVELPKYTETRGPKHRFRILTKAESITAYGTLTGIILDGIPAAPTGDGVTLFSNTLIHPLCDCMQEIEVRNEKTKDGMERISIYFAVFKSASF